MLDGLAEPLSDGTWVNSKIARIVELIREEYPTLDVVWIPRDKRAAEDAAFAIVETLADGQQVVAFYVQTEADFDERVLERIIRADMLNKNPQKVNAEMEARAAAYRLAQEKEQRERLLDSLDPYNFAIKSGKHKYTGSDGKPLFYDY